MSGQTAVVIGSTGLIGGYLLEELLKDDSFSVVRILVRRPANTIHPKLQQQVVNFEDITDYTNKFGNGDVIFSCIGTTQSKVKGDKAAYYKIDHDIPVNAAAIGTKLGFKKFMMVSSVGADASSSNFYLRLKGETENDVKQYAYESIGFFRPSMLLGKRNESRPVEKVMQGVSKFLSLFIFGSLKKYRAITAAEVAKSMIVQSKKSKTGISILEYTQMKELLK